MKKFFAMCFVIILVCIPFSACKKGTLDSNAKTFSLYFPTSVTNTGTKKSQETNITIGSMQAYYSITFVADKSWTNEIFVSDLEFEIVSNTDTEIDFIVKLTTNEEEEIIPCVCSTQKGKAILPILKDKQLVGDTSIEISLSIPGGNGIDGIIYDKAGALTGFVWGIENIIFKAEHK